VRGVYRHTPASRSANADGKAPAKTAVARAAEVSAVAEAAAAGAD